MSSFPQVTIRHSIGNTITVPNQLDVRETTYFSDNATTPTTTLFAVNAVGFNTASLLLLNAMGAENAEFVESTTHSATDFTVPGITFDHNRGEVIQEVNYNQIVIEKGPTIAGPFVALATLGMRVTQQNTIYYDTAGLSTDFYRIAWRNSVSTLQSSFSDPISVDAYPVNSVANIIYPVLTAMGVSEDDPKINTTFLLSAVNDARKMIHARLYGIRQDWQAEFEFPIKVLAGRNYVELPDNIDFNVTDRSLLSARFLIGNILAPFNLRYVDKRTINQVSWSVMGGITTTDTAIAAGTIDLNSSGDFPNASGGVAYVATTDFDQTILQIQYTSVDFITNQLLGVTGVTRAFPEGTQVWANPNINQPIFYTVYDDKIVFDAVIPDSMQANNIYLDFYKKIDEVTDLYQELPEHYRYAYAFWLKYAIKARKDISLPNTDSDYQKFEQLTKALFDNLYLGQTITIETQ